MSPDDIIAAARSIVGLTEPSDELGALVDPGGDPAHQSQIERLSLCMLTYRGLLCRVLAIPADLAETDRPYVPGSIPRILVRLLGDAACVPTEGTPPAPGDALWYEAAPGHPEHVDACVLEIYEGDSGFLLSAVAGGQRDTAGHETIAEVARALRWNGHGWVDTGTGRRVRWVLDAAALCERYGDAS